MGAGSQFNWGGVSTNAAPVTSNLPSGAGTAGGMAGAAPVTSQMPTGANPASSTGSSFNYYALSPSQQQAYNNGTPVANLGAPGAQYGPTATPTYSVGANTAPPVSATNASGFTAVPFGNSTSYPQSPSSEFQSELSYQNSPFMTPAAIANQNAVSAAGDPMNGQSININGQQVPWNSLSQTQQTMYSYFNGTGQQIPAGFMQTYQGPNTAANASYNTAGVTGPNAPAAAGNGSGTAPNGVPYPASVTQTGNMVPYTGSQTTPFGANGTLAATAAGQTPPVSGTTPAAGTGSGAQSGAGANNNLSSYMMGLLAQALFGSGTNSSGQNNIVTTPLGYTQYQGTPQSSGSSNMSSIMPYIAALMMGMFGYGGAQQGTSGGAILGNG